MTSTAQPKPGLEKDRAAVTEFRRSLVQAHLHWDKVHNRYTPPHSPGTESDAYAGSLMAANYSYTLAAVLAWTEREFGLDFAVALTGVAELILSDGDPDDLNADVTPAASATPG